MNSINERVKELRLSLHMSQEEFGNAIGLSKSGISNIESGVRNIRDNHIKLLSTTFNVNENWLRTGQDLAKEVKGLETFISFLKATSYLVDIVQATESECEFVLKRKGEETLFTQAEFELFQEEVRNSIDYQVWKKNHGK